MLKFNYFLQQLDKLDTPMPQGVGFFLLNTESKLKMLPDLF